MLKDLLLVSLIVVIFALTANKAGAGGQNSNRIYVTCPPFSTAQSHSGNFDYGDHQWQADNSDSRANWKGKSAFTLMKAYYIEAEKRVFVSCLTGNNGLSPATGTGFKVSDPKLCTFGARWLSKDSTVELPPTSGVNCPP